MINERTTNEALSELADKALELYEQGWTKTQLINTLTRKGLKLSPEIKTAIKVAWTYYQIK